MFSLQDSDEGVASSSADSTPLAASTSPTAPLSGAPDVDSLTGSPEPPPPSLAEEVPAAAETASGTTVVSTSSTRIDATTVVLITSTSTAQPVTSPATEHSPTEVSLSECRCDVAWIPHRTPDVNNELWFYFLSASAHAQEPRDLTSTTARPMVDTGWRTTTTSQRPRPTTGPTARPTAPPPAPPSAPPPAPPTSQANQTGGELQTCYMT